MPVHRSRCYASDIYIYIYIRVTNKKILLLLFTIIDKLSILLFKELPLFGLDFFFVLKYPYIPMFKYRQI